MKRKSGIRALIASKTPRTGSVRFVAIDGHGGSGKSTFTKLLARKLDAQIINTDDFASWDNPLNWWPLVIEKVFKPITDGARSLNYDRSSWWEDHNPGPVINQPVTSIMILEGVSSLRKEFREYISLGIFIDTPEAVRLRRVIRRDIHNGKSEEEVADLWRQWSSDEDAYMKRDNPKGYADVVVDGTKPFEEQLADIQLR